MQNKNCYKSNSQQHKNGALEHQDKMTPVSSVVVIVIFIIIIIITQGQKKFLSFLGFSVRRRQDSKSRPKNNTPYTYTTENVKWNKLKNHN